MDSNSMDGPPPDRSHYPIPRQQHALDSHPSSSSAPIHDTASMANETASQTAKRERLQYDQGHIHTTTALSSTPSAGLSTSSDSQVDPTETIALTGLSIQTEMDSAVSHDEHDFTHTFNQETHDASGSDVDPDDKEDLEVAEGVEVVFYTEDWGSNSTLEGSAELSEAAVKAASEYEAVSKGVQLPLPRSKQKKDRALRRLVERQQKVQQAQKKLVEVQKAADLTYAERLKKPFNFLGLPEDVRRYIYDLCFRRPIGIVPAVNLHRMTKPSDYQCTKYAWYQYQWAGHRQRESKYFSSLPCTRGYMQNVWATRLDTPTEEEMLLIRQGSELPDTPAGAPDRTDIRNFLEIRPDQYPNGQITVRRNQCYRLSGFICVNLLRSCRQIHDEAAKVLYSCNTYCFNSDAPYATRFPGSEHPALRDKGSRYPSAEEALQLPGWHLEDGSRQGDDSIMDAIDGIFDTSRHQTQQIWKDPMLHFFTRIGRKNAELLRSIKIEGSFSAYVDDGWIHANILGLEAMLPVYACVLSKICGNLTKVYLDGNIGDATFKFQPGQDPREGTVRDWSNEDLLDSIVGKFVECLPRLQHLHVGFSADDEILDRRDFSWGTVEQAKQQAKWGRVLQWSKVVEDRSTPTTESHGCDKAEVKDTKKEPSGFGHLRIEDGRGNMVLKRDADGVDFVEV